MTTLQKRKRANQVAEPLGHVLYCLFQSSGVTVLPECITVFNEQKLRHRYRYIVYALTDDLTKICVHKVRGPEATYDEFLEELFEAESRGQCRYGVFDAEFRLRDGQMRSKLVFFLWSPECASVKQKMIYTTSKEYLKKALVGVAKYMQACDHGDLAYTNMMELCLRSEPDH